ncbi:hypothetical protein [Curtobacterium flaccumfaciens]|uniref:hypothetical protein n=1 Tax=Curtobacterium flaccumfaciens TaxID=2035 RepID=UPI001BDF675A|nr:hypothetical protein [Curtobacterium flaccumfaciens]MBT1631579.1 hypothetical protein [Curtobacterium flaccumfaciens pv. oortii]MCS5524653.1 hypothetical protein [Curtobacterium flaccumfaciens pv. oortii]MCX2847023.1 hypothetical protein [Curtobacterium flaccumfaciens pv. oortii]
MKKILPLNGSRVLALVIAVAGAVGLGVLLSPVAAQAEPNYRVCGVFNSASQADGIGTGLVVKVYKNGDATCGSKIDYMDQNYAAAYRGSSAQQKFIMLSCEEFASRTGTSGDPCDTMDVNSIYRFTSAADLLHPSSHPSHSFWHH